MNSYKIRWTLTPIVLLLIGASGAVVKHWPRTVPYAQCSPIYQRYATMPGIQAAFIKDYAINKRRWKQKTLSKKRNPTGGH